MRRLADTIISWYTRFVLGHPLLVILCLVVLIGILGYKAMDFKIDASAETLLLEDDPDLYYSRQLNKRYGVSDSLFVAFSPREGDLLSNKNLDTLRRLRDELAVLEPVDSVFTILDVPLLESPPISYSEFSGSLPTLQSQTIDKNLARKELRESYFYRDLIVSSDMTTTALIVNLKIDENYRELIQQRNTYLEKKSQTKLSVHEKSELKTLNGDIRRRLDELNKVQHENIAAVRSIIDRYRTDAEIFLGGVSMIADDMISFIRKDLAAFGFGVLILLIAMLGIIFRRIRWVVLPTLCCFFSVIAMMGILATFGWEVTVISSNFISLQLIITLAIAVHLIVRYREIQKEDPEADQQTLIQRSIRSKFIPCLYAALTTIAGFSSLLLCDIKPVIHFGWMMSAGIVVSLVLTFILFPAGMALMKKPIPPNITRTHGFSLIDFLAQFTQSHGTLILVIAGILSLLSIVGISRLMVENSFIDYFKKSTEIYQGMELIDQKLGGTSPLDVIVQFESFESEDLENEDEYSEDPFDEMDGEDEDKYWFTEGRMQVIEEVHDYLDGLPETGKVLSVGTLLKIGRNLKGGVSLDSLEIAVLYTKLPDDYKDLILRPYLSIENNEARFSIRVKDSIKSLKRDAFLKQIKNDLISKFELEMDKVHLAGTMVLYNNMLQSLFSSQIKTLGIVAVVLLGMFMILFRSLKVALIAFFPNLLSAAVILGIMGWLNIPLDMMTITIAAISIGIAVDDTIHYIYRFKKEIIKDGDYYRTLQRCHGSIGHAMYYTSIIIIVGFSILVFSNFWPIIYFGLFTGLAMFIALIFALTLLPQFLVMFKPFKQDAQEK
ncbi:RND family transporter [Thermodesulfobacteriota bacterium]